MLSEILDEIKAIDASPKAIRSFGITFFVVLGAIGALMLYKASPNGYIWLGFGALFLTLGILAPGTLKGPHKIWMAFAAVLGYFMSRLILCVLFYLIVTPTGLIMRLFGKDVLNEKWDKEASSYWIKRDEKPYGKDKYQKMF